MIVLDTTVLVYAVGADHTLRDPCRDLIGAIADGRVEATTTVEVLQEFAHVRARRRGRAEAAARARDYGDLLAPLLIATEEDLLHGLALFERGTRIGAFDAVLAACAARVHAAALVSADAAFTGESSLPHVIPDADGVAALLRAQ